jgi:small subunit ribosomal protein S1
MPEKKRKDSTKKEGGEKVRKITKKTRALKRPSPKAKKEEPKKETLKRRRTPAPRAVKEPKKVTVKKAVPPEKKIEKKKEEGKKEITRLNLAELEEREYSSEEFEKQLEMYEKTMGEMKEGEIIRGKVMGVTKDDVIVDVGFKSEGIIPIPEFPQPLNIKVGDEIEVFLEEIEDQDGQLILSKQKADFMRVWDKIKTAHDQGTLIDGKIIKRIKGGMVVDLLGVDAFLPGSQIALRQVPDFDALVGQTMKLKVLKLNKLRRNIVVSRRVVLEEERESQKTRLLAEIEPGQVREGLVKNITDFGVFIDLGGVDGLLHITDMSWGRISHPSELVAIGDKINVKILDFDEGTSRVSLGLKQLTPYPWENIEEKYPITKRVRGKVVSITDYGAFVELEKGVEGLIHISEMSWTRHIKHPSKVLAIGDMVDAVVLSVDKNNEKISLGIKQIEPDPWESIEQRYPVGSKVLGKVRNLTAFGVFIELEEGIDGLIHISDLSWTKRIQHPSEVIRKGEKIEVVVLHIDKENRRISLGHKQLRSDPWPQLIRKYRLGSETEGKVTKLLDRGVTVKLEEEIEGFVPIEHLGKPELTKPQEAFSEGDVLPLRVIEFDRSLRKIVLSVSAYFKGREKAELEAFLAKHPTKTIKVEELVEERPKLDAEIKEGERTQTEETKEPTPEVLPPEEEPPPKITDEKKEDESPEE